MAEMRREATTDRAREEGLRGDPETMVVKALENAEYDWRTIDGITRETGLSSGIVEDILRSLGGKIIQTSIPDGQGRSLFTTRAHYLRKQSFVNRILSTASDTVK